MIGGQSRTKQSNPLECRLIFNQTFNLIFNGARGAQGLIKYPQGTPGENKKIGARNVLKIQFLKIGTRFFFENSIFHKSLIQGGLGGAEHPPARY